MLKDIPQLKVENIGIAVVPRTKQQNDELELWDIYLVNTSKDTITNVMVVSEGYGTRNGETVTTSTLRFFFDQVSYSSFVKVEAIQANVFDLTNQYWISFKLNGELYDRKYVFVKGSIESEHFTHVPLLGKQGVLII